MNRQTGFAYSRRRILGILAVAGAAAAVAFAAGRPGVGWGALAAAPVGILNYYLMYSAVHAGEAPAGREESSRVQTRLVKRSLLRMGISMAALLVAIRFGPEALIGVLIGVVAEMLTYMGDAARLFVSRKR